MVGLTEKSRVLRFKFWLHTKLRDLIVCVCKVPSIPLHSTRNSDHSLRCAVRLQRHKAQNTNCKGASTLRAAERAAKDAKLRIWTNYTNTAPVIAAKDKEFTATVLEVVNGDALVVRMPNNTAKKIFLASIRPPREK